MEILKKEESWSGSRGYEGYAERQWLPGARRQEQEQLTVANGTAGRCSVTVAPVLACKSLSARREHKAQNIPEAATRGCVR